MGMEWRHIIAHPRKKLFFFFNDTATTEIYPLSLHDALPISFIVLMTGCSAPIAWTSPFPAFVARSARSEEHTSELQSRRDLVCRLLLEKKKTPDNSPDDFADPTTAFI